MTIKSRQHLRSSPALTVDRYKLFGDHFLLLATTSRSVRSKILLYDLHRCFFKTETCRSPDHREEMLTLVSALSSSNPTMMLFMLTPCASRAFNHGRGVDSVHYFYYHCRCQSIHSTETHSTVRNWRYSHDRCLSKTCDETSFLTETDFIDVRTSSIDHANISIYARMGTTFLLPD